MRKACSRYFPVVLLLCLASLQGSVKVWGQVPARQTVSIMCKCDDEGQSFAEMLAKRFPLVAYQILPSTEPSTPAVVHVSIVSSQVAPSEKGVREGRQRYSAPSPVVLTNSDSERQSVHSIRIECDFPSGKFVEEVRHCDRVGFASLVDEVAADLATALKMEAVEAEPDGGE